MTSPAQQRWDLLTGPIQTDSTPKVPSALRPGSPEWLDQRIRTRSEIGAVGQRRLTMSDQENAGRTSRVDTFVEVHRLATFDTPLNRAGQPGGGVAKWMKLAAAAAVMVPTAISLGASPAAAMSSPDGDLQRSKVPKVGIDIGELKPLEGNLDRPSAPDKAKMWDRTKHDPVTVPTPAEPSSPKEDEARLDLDKQSFAELIEQARADLDCDVGMRDMMFDPESDVCDALTLVQIRYKNELDRIVPTTTRRRLSMVLVLDIAAMGLAKSPTVQLASTAKRWITHVKPTSLRLTGSSRIKQVR